MDGRAFTSVAGAGNGRRQALRWKGKAGVGNRFREHPVFAGEPESDPHIAQGHDEVIQDTGDARMVHFELLDEAMHLLGKMVWPGIMVIGFKLAFDVPDEDTDSFLDGAIGRAELVHLRS